MRALHCSSSFSQKWLKEIIVISKPQINMCQHYEFLEESECAMCVAYNKALAKVMLLESERAIRRELEQGKCNHKALQQLYDSNEYSGTRVTEGWYWITINPKEQDLIIQVLEAKIEKMVQKKNVASAMWTFEQRGESEEEMGKGVHTHILLKNEGSRDDNFRRQIKVMFEGLCGSQLHIQIKKIPERWVDDKKEYLRGNKWDDQKDLKVEVDKIWREKFQLQTCYEYTKG